MIAETIFWILKIDFIFILRTGKYPNRYLIAKPVKSAVEAGDLDAQIDAASAAVRERFAQ